MSLSPQFKREIVPSSADDPHKPPRGVGRQPVVRSRANITSACLACKKRKRKCQGGLPCPHCESLNIQCIYDERLDKRRKAFNEKARAETDFQGRLLEGLLKAIKSDHASTILDLVRADGSLNDIASKLELLDMFQSTSSDDLAHASEASDLLDSRLADSPYSHYPEPQSAGSNGDLSTSHGLCSGQLLTVQHQSSQNYPMSQGNSIPSLSQVLLEAQKYRENDETLSMSSTPTYCTHQRPTDPMFSKPYAYYDSRFSSSDPFRTSVSMSALTTSDRRHPPTSDIDRLLNPSPT